MFNNECYVSAFVRNTKIQLRYTLLVKQVNRVIYYNAVMPVIRPVSRRYQTKKNGVLSTWDSPPPSFTHHPSHTHTHT